MKTYFKNSFFFILLAVTSVLVLTKCDKDEDTQPEAVLQVDETYGYSTINLAACQTILNNLPNQPLSDAEKEGILFMREEEKLAMDIYLKSNELWNLQVFSNISESEATHFSAMLKLIQRYNLQDPAENNGTGVFTNPTLQQLYDSLFLRSQTELTEALKVGAEIEEIDILDLKNQLENIVDNQDIEMVYTNLMAASRNHLRAMVRNLENRGIIYVPQFLDQVDFDEIINSPWEKGNN